MSYLWRKNMQKAVRIPSDADTKIAKSSTVTGNVEVIGTLLINGRIEGDVVSHDDVFIGKTAVINGDVTAKNAYVFGIIQGNVKTDGHIYLASSSKLFGDIVSQSINVEKGSIYRGTCQTSDHTGVMEKIDGLDSDKKSDQPKDDSVIESL
jgi:cytoskeletal protein CcmA (bactofilin family)